MPKSFYSLIVKTLIICLLFLGSCKKEESPTSPPVDNNIGPGRIQTSGSIQLPSQMNSSGLKIKSGLNSGTITGSNYNIKLNENTVQLVSILDASDNPILMSLNVTQTQSGSFNINANSTAEALVFLNPFFCTSTLSEATSLKQKIKSLQSFNYLVNTITNQLQSGSFSISENNTQLQTALDSVFKDLVRSTTTQSLNKLHKIVSPQDFTPSPNFEVNGLKLTDIQQTSSSLSFKIANRAKRWISVYVDKSTNGTSFTRSTFPVDLIPSPSVSIWNLITQGIQIPTEYSKTIQNTTTGYRTFSVKCYGLGVLNNINDDEFSRAILPAAMSGVFDLGLPIFEVITGMKLDANLRGRPADHPFYKLAQKVVTDILGDVAKKARFYTWYREGDIVKIAAEISKTMLLTCANNPSYIAQILTEIVGREIARSLVNSWLFPIRVINATITAINIGYALGSILATDAVTDFKFENTTTTLPISVKGIVKSYTTSNAISGASISAYDVNLNLVQTSISNTAGQYSFNSNYGQVKIIVRANGYKPTEQILQIPQDIINQNPAIYYAQTTWLSDYSSEVGNINGTVRNATNLNPISGVNVKLRRGINDPNQEIVQQTTSISNGSFSFNSIPSGTYTAFFSKTDFISDYLVLSVLGNQSTSGFNMNLSPNIQTSSGYRIVLTWGIDPGDLDSHLFTPAISGTTYHIYWANKGTLTSPPYANLDVDDVTSYGPETITIAQTFTGNYYYSVYHYAGSGDLKSSSAIINLYGINGHIRTWNVPTSGDGRWWNVFSLNGSTGQVTNIDQITNSPPSGFSSMMKIDSQIKK